MTSPDISPWRALFGEVERVYVESGKLLCEADGLLDRAGYTLRDGENSVEWQLSGKPTRPAWWFPGWVGRLYVPRSAAETPQLLYVTVYLYQRAGDDIHTVDEAVIAGGVWRFKDGALRTDPWLAKGWAWRRKEEPYGVVAARALTNPKYALARGRCVGVPLSKVTDPETLDAEVVAPLVAIARDATW